MDPRKASVLVVAPFGYGMEYATTKTRAEEWPKRQPQGAETRVAVVYFPS